MIRSHTKGIYQTDTDSSEVTRIPAIQDLVKRIDSKTKGMDHGFARLYSTVVTEYFGGMRRHLRTARRVLKPNSLCAYIVGDQSSYAQVHIPTAEILARVAKSEGYGVEGIETWRTRRSSSTSKNIQENILFLRSPM
jgi:hypothetical protein